MVVAKRINIILYICLICQILLSALEYIVPKLQLKVVRYLFLKWIKDTQMLFPSHFWINTLNCAPSVLFHMNTPACWLHTVKSSRKGYWQPSYPSHTSSPFIQVTGRHLFFVPTCHCFLWNALCANALQGLLFSTQKKTGFDKVAEGALPPSEINPTCLMAMLVGCWRLKWSYNQSPR